MKGEAIATMFAGGLQVEVKGKEWYILIRQIGDESYASFFAFLKKDISPADIEKVIPNWKTLDWKLTKPNRMLPKEECAVNERFKINLVWPEDTLTTEQQIIQEFQNFMGA